MRIVTLSCDRREKNQLWVQLVATLTSGTEKDLLKMQSQLKDELFNKLLEEGIMYFLFLYLHKSYCHLKTVHVKDVRNCKEPVLVDRL